VRKLGPELLIWHLGPLLAIGVPGIFLVRFRTNLGPTLGPLVPISKLHERPPKGGMA